MNRERKAVIAGNEISQLYTFRLGGYDQKVLIEGKSKKLPVVVMLHGGPGTPIPMSVGCRGLFPEFTDRFLMVYWDQLGCGINNHVIDDRFGIDSFADMTVDLLGEIRTLFPDNRILLFAVSWGSILSAKVLERATVPVDAVVVCGQIVKNLFLNDEVFSALEQSALPKKKLEEIRKMQADSMGQRELQLLSSSIRKYTDGMFNKKGERAPMGRIVKGLLTSPDYRLSDVKAMAVNGYRHGTALWQEILKTDLSPVLAGTAVPYTILQGDTDLVTPTGIVLRLVKESRNPLLQCQVVERTGHMPGLAMMKQAQKNLEEQAYRNGQQSR